MYILLLAKTVDPAWYTIMEKKQGWIYLLKAGEKSKKLESQ